MTTPFYQGPATAIGKDGTRTAVNCDLRTHKSDRPGSLPDMRGSVRPGLPLGQMFTLEIPGGTTLQFSCVDTNGTVAMNGDPVYPR
jgi:hypothetical protein